jgi:hypothetical protein
MLAIASAMTATTAIMRDIFPMLFSSFGVAPAPFGVSERALRGVPGVPVVRS